jgi:hypothetical protein
MEKMPKSRLQLKLQSGPSKIATWGHLISPLSFYGMGGTVNWDLVLENDLASTDESWSAQGKIKIADVELKDKANGKKVDQLNASISLLGKEARIETASFRLGSSRFALRADVMDFFRPSAKYQLSSPELNPSDLPGFPVGSATRIKNLTASGEILMQDGGPLVQGSVASPEGIWQQSAYRNLQADIAWSLAGVRFTNLELQTLNGTIRSDGSWVARADGSKNLELISQIDAIDLQPLLTRTFPALSHRIEGRLDLQSRFNATTHDGQLFPTELKGSGEMRIRQGTIKDFNLFSQFLSRGSESSTSAKISSVLPASMTTLLDRRDTPFDSLQVNFTVEGQQIRAGNLILSTPDCTITATGWVGFNGQTKWNGSMVLAPWVVQELQRENKIIRYLLDRRGRLAISFRVDGMLPNVQVRPENRALAQALRLRSSSKGNEPLESGDKDQNNKEKASWLWQSFDHLLRR